MRSEEEVIDLVLRFTEQDENIRVVVMNGSRVNPNVKKDPFQDYDIACLVHDVKPYVRNQAIPPYFGEILIIQTPDEMGVDLPEEPRCYAFLMQFLDGVRIDLSFHGLERLDEVTSDSLTRVLVDKDGRVPELPPPGEASYYPSPPTARQFFECCNEFWWVTPYVAKGLWRDQLIYAKHCLEFFLREELMKMMVWYFGVLTGFQKSPGNRQKNLKAALDAETWALLEKTYSDSQPERTWEALFAMGQLFRQAARVVAARFDYVYPEAEDARVSAFIRHIKNLPKDAKTIY